MGTENKNFYKNLKQLLDDTSSWPSEYIYKFIYAFFLARKEANNLQIENILDSEKISNNTETVKNNRVGKNKLNDKVKNVSNITDLYFISGPINFGSLGCLVIA